MAMSCLHWPETLPRTPRAARRPSIFGIRARGYVSPLVAATFTLHELALLGATHVAITSDLPINSDGLPYDPGHDGAAGARHDPGIAIWCTLTEQRVFACDHWQTPGANLMAIGRSIEAVRSLARFGMNDVVRMTMAGFGIPGVLESALADVRDLRAVAP